MHNAPNRHHSHNAIPQLIRSYQERCRIELTELSTDENESPETIDEKLDILDAQILASCIPPASLVDDLLVEVVQHPTSEIASSAEDICQWFCRRHRQDGAAQAYRLRNALVDMELATPVTMFNFAMQKILGDIGTKDAAGAHHLVELVLHRVLKLSPLRTEALILSATNFLDGVAVPTNLEKAHSRLVEAARSESLEGIYNLGLFYSGRFHLMSATYIYMDLAACFYAVAQRGGHLKAQTNLSLLHIQKLIQNPDPNWGWDQLREAAQRGDETAQACISELSNEQCDVVAESYPHKSTRIH